MKVKDKLLEKLHDNELLELAGPLSDSISDRTSRSVLIKTVKESLSAEEISRKVKAIKGQHVTTKKFFNLLLFKISIVSISAGVLIMTVASIYYSYQSMYLNFLVYYDVERWFALRQVTLIFNSIGAVLRLIGVLLLVCWLFLSAFKISSENLTAASILVLGSTMILFVILANFFQIYTYPYYG